MAFRCGLLEVYMAELTSTMRDLSDVDHREAKFENASVVIKFIHASRTLHNEEGACFIAEDIFSIMHYRNVVVSHTYFQEENCHLGAVSRKGIV